MISRIFLLLALTTTLTGCIYIPDTQMVDRIQFNYLPPDHVPLSYDDMLCCYRCEA